METCSMRFTCGIILKKNNNKSGYPDVPYLVNTWIREMSSRENKINAAPACGVK